MGVWALARRKAAKRRAYRAMLREVPAAAGHAVLRPRIGTAWNESLARHTEEILAQAERMLRDDNRFFSFPYRTRELERPWQYDPLERRYWPERHYTEQRLHGPDTPRDVKIVWEINRFKDLVLLGQAARITSDPKYADEVRRRLLSWIEDNPFAATINWASALEISIRLIAWTSTLLLLRDAGFDVTDPKINRSVFEQASYLAADLSTDKILFTNHLIGEVSGLLAISLVWEFPGCERFEARARQVLESEILFQVFSDGVSREASGWYHQFVTDFFDLAQRVTARAGAPLSERFSERLSKMKTYLSAITVNGEVVRYGDADDGWALWFEGDRDAWATDVFGPAASEASFEHGFFPSSGYAAFFREESFLFVRGGAFGMGGSGFSSHAHDDLLSPVLYLQGHPVIVDAGTFVYNGDPAARMKYRREMAHNGLQLGQGSPAIQKLNFGWKRARRNAELAGVEFREAFTATAGRCGEWRGIRRSIALLGDHLGVVHDEFGFRQTTDAQWRFHLHPMWKHSSTLENGSLVFKNSDGWTLLITPRGEFDSQEIEVYDYSPSYRVETKALLLHLRARAPLGAYEVRFAISQDLS